MCFIYWFFLQWQFCAYTGHILVGKVPNNRATVVQRCKITCDTSSNSLMVAQHSHLSMRIILRPYRNQVWVRVLSRPNLAWVIQTDPRGGHFLCRAVRDARLYMGYFWEIFCTFSARWVPFFNKISVCFLQGGYLFWRKILYLSNKMEPIYKKFSVFYSTKLLHLHIKISVYFYMMSIFSRDLL